MVKCSIVAKETGCEIGDIALACREKKPVVVGMSVVIHLLVQVMVYVKDKKRE
jgi:hypothetical protein